MKRKNKNIRRTYIPRIDKINEEEFNFVRFNQRKYSKYYKLISDLTNYLYKIFVKFDDNYTGVFPFHGSLAKNLMLATLSILRRHTNQGQILIRLALEYLVLFIYGCHDPTLTEYSSEIKKDLRKYHDLLSIATKWLIKSKYINEIQDFKEFKDFINETSAHATFHYPMFDTNYYKELNWIEVKFFDDYDDTRMELELLGNCKLVIRVLEVIIKVSSDYPQIHLRKTINIDMILFNERYIELEK